MSAATRMGTFQGVYQRPPTTYPATTYAFPRQIPDDYEKWYTEAGAHNRMLLSLRSGLQKEINWALERMCRLSHNDQFILRLIPGLADALVEWPEWYVERGFAEFEHANMFSLPKDAGRRRRHALEVTFILRNASLNDPNAQYLAAHRRTLLLLRHALHRVKLDSDADAEFLLHIVDLLHSIVTCLHQQTLQLQQLSLQTQQLSEQQLAQQRQLQQAVPAAFKYLATETLIGPLEDLIATSNDRTMIITALRTLTLIISFPQNAVHIISTSPALYTAICYLPLLSDTALITPCLDYIYAHLSHPPTVKSFLHNPDLPGMLKLLVTLLLREQQEEMTTVDLISTPVRTAPAVAAFRRHCELTEEEVEKMAKVAEPERSYEWMRALFVASDAEELTQVEFWNLYRDTFGPRQDVQPILSAADVIKNVSQIFPTAQAMVLPGQPQRFVIKGIARKMIDIMEERFKCLWDNSSCTSSNFQNLDELWKHVSEHIVSLADEDTSCRWGTCQFSTTERPVLLHHVATHMPPASPPSRHPSQPENITLPIEPFPHPCPNPTSRPPPPPPNPQLTYPYPSVDPPSTSLTALLILRVLFRASFAATDAAPRADEDHFGFPGIIEEDSDDEHPDEDEDIRGQKRGRRAFTGVRKLLENVRVKDPALMEWIGEILDVSMEEKPANV